MNTMSKNNEKQRKLIMVGAFVVLMALVLTIVPTFASGQPAVPTELSDILTKLIFYVGLIFRTVGILLAVYAVGQMIMAFKDENPDAKTKAATLLVVAIVLISLPSIINAMGLEGYLTGSKQ